MDKLLGIDKLVNFMRVYKQNGGIIGMYLTLFRVDDLKWGTLVGEDKFGNKYYENNYYFVGRNRWVRFSPTYGLNYDATHIPVEWYGWMHYKTDLIPSRDPHRPKYKWMAEHTPNLSGTDKAYMPYSTTKPKIHAWKPED